MSGFDEQKFAARFRDWVREIVKDEVDRQRPPYRYGVVVAVDAVNKKVDVDFEGAPSTVPVRYGSVAPSAGDVVRVAGLRHDRYVDDVVNPA